MAFLQQLLKPNRWKVGILTTFFLLGRFFAPCWAFKEAGVAGPLLCSILYKPEADLLLEIFLFPGTYVIQFGPEFIFKLMTTDWWGILLFSLSFVYWYLLACLIYFVFSKIFKRTNKTAGNRFQKASRRANGHGFAEGGE